MRFDQRTSVAAAAVPAFYLPLAKDQMLAAKPVDYRFRPARQLDDFA
jgi:hypothetical protein